VNTTAIMKTRKSWREKRADDKRKRHLVADFEKSLCDL